MRRDHLRSAAVPVVVAICISVWTADAAAHGPTANNQTTESLSPVVVDANVGYSKLVGGVYADTDTALGRMDVWAPVYGLELSWRPGRLHQLGLRGDYAVRKRLPGAFYDFYAWQVGAFYGIVVSPGHFRFSADGGLGVNSEGLGHSDVYGATVPGPTLFATIGVSWKPVSFLGVGVDAMATFSRAPFRAMGSVELSLPPGR